MGVTPIYEIKRGDTFAERFAPVFDAGESIPDFSAHTVRSQIRRSETGELITGLLVTWINHSGLMFELTPLVSTSNWPIGTALWDIEVTDGNGVITTSQTVYIRVLQKETQ